MHFTATELASNTPPPDVINALKDVQQAPPEPDAAQDHPAQPQQLPVRESTTITAPEHRGRPQTESVEKVSHSAGSAALSQTPVARHAAPGHTSGTTSSSQPVAAAENKPAPPSTSSGGTGNQPPTDDSTATSEQPEPEPEPEDTGNAANTTSAIAAFMRSPGGYKEPAYELTSMPMPDGYQELFQTLRDPVDDVVDTGELFTHIPDVKYYIARMNEQPRTTPEETADPPQDQQAGTQNIPPETDKAVIDPEAQNVDLPPLTPDQVVDAARGSAVIWTTTPLGDAVEYNQIAGTDDRPPVKLPTFGDSHPSTFPPVPIEFAPGMGMDVYREPGPDYTPMPVNNMLEAVAVMSATDANSQPIMALNPETGSMEPAKDVIYSYDPVRVAPEARNYYADLAMERGNGLVVRIRLPGSFADRLEADIDREFDNIDPVLEHVVTQLGGLAKHLWEGTPGPDGRRPIRPVRPPNFRWAYRPYLLRQNPAKRNRLEARQPQNVTNPDD